MIKIGRESQKLKTSECFQCLRSLLPDIFNDDIIETLLFNVVNPDIFNDDIQLVLDNVANPETFSGDIIAVLFDNVVNPETLNDETNVVLFNVVKPETLMMKQMVYCLML